MKKQAFLVHLESFRTNFKSDNSSELILLNYFCLIIQYIYFLLEKKFVIFDRLSINNFKVQAEVCVVLKTIQKLKFPHGA